MNVLLPTPGTPVMPTRTACPLAGSSSSSSRWACASWSARVLSTSVIAFASARRLPARTSPASVATAGAVVVTPPLLRAAGALRRPAALLRCAHEAEHPPRRLHDVGPGAEDRPHACRLERRVVPRRDDPSDRHHDVARSFLPQVLDELRDQRLVSAGLRRDPDHVDV